MRRIEHIWKNGQELKWCCKCLDYLPLINFNKNFKSWDGLCYLCIYHSNNKRQNSSRRNALSTWKNIRRRIEGHPSYLKRGIKVKISKDVFVAWYARNWFPRCRIDRINNEGHYELSNIQLLTQNEHNVKARQDRLDFLGIVEPEGERYCYTCESLKLYKEFYTKKRKISKSNPLGLDETCKQCSREKRMKYYYDNKGDHKCRKYIATRSI